MTDKLAEIKAFAATRKIPAPRKEYRPPVPEDFHPRTVLGFDQSLTNTGWALVAFSGRQVRVEHCGVIHPQERPQTGYARTFAAAPSLRRQMRQVLLDHRFDELVMELPSVHGFRTDSSIASGMVLCTVADELGVEDVRQIQRQQACAALVGNGNANKKESGKVVDDLVGILRPQRPWNEHVRDAVLLAMYAARRKL